MKHNIFFLIFLLLDLFGCKTVDSKTYSESTDLVLYTQGGINSNIFSIDADFMYHFLKTLNIQVEFFPRIDGSFHTKDQSQQEIKDGISEVVNNLETNSTLWWYIFSHGSPGEIVIRCEDNFKYEQMFDYMLEKVNERNMVIKRLVIIVQACHSGSLIPIIKKDRYKGRLYDELIVFTSVTSEQGSMRIAVFEELVSAASFLKNAKYNTDKTNEEIINMVSEEVKPYPVIFNSIKSFYKEFKPDMIQFSKGDTSTNKLTETQSDSSLSNITLSDKSEPTWKDLINLTIWLFKNYNPVNGEQDPQFYTSKEEIQNEPLFK